MEENTEVRKKWRFTANQIWLCILIFVVLLAFASPFSYSVRGKVIDDETGKIKLLLNFFQLRKVSY